MFEGLINIRLIISFPNQKIREDIYTGTSCIDILPTLLDICDIDSTQNYEGRKLPGFGAPNISSGRTIYSVEAKSNSKFQPLDHGTVAMIKDQYKLIHYIGHDESVGDEFYDLWNDPEELENRIIDMKPRSDEMLAELNEKIGDVNSQFGEE